MIITYFNGIIICKTFLRASFIFLLVIFSMEWFSCHVLELGGLETNMKMIRFFTLQFFWRHSS